MERSKFGLNSTEACTCLIKSNNHGRIGFFCFPRKCKPRISLTAHARGKFILCLLNFPQAYDMEREIQRKTKYFIVYQFCLINTQGYIGKQKNYLFSTKFPACISQLCIRAIQKNFPFQRATYVYIGGQNRLNLCSSWMYKTRGIFTRKRRTQHRNNVNVCKFSIANQS